MRPLVRAVITPLLALLLAIRPAAAQAAGLAPPTFESWTPASGAEARRDPMRWLLGDGSTDHRYVGFYVGAATGVVLGLIGLGYCGDTDSNSDGCGPLTYVLVPVAGGALLGMFGALIGGIFPK